MSVFQEGLAYLVPCSQIQEEDRERVEAVSSFFEYGPRGDLEDPYYRLFNATDAQILEELGYFVSVDGTSRIRDIYMVSCRKYPPGHGEEEVERLKRVEEKVIVSNGWHWEGAGKQEYREITYEELSEAVGDRPIVLICTHGRPVSVPENLVQFHVFLWSCDSEQGGEPRETPDSMWGYEVRCRDSSKPVWDNGVAIHTSEGHIAASVSTNCLFIYHDCIHYDDADSRAIYRRIMQEAATLLNDPQTLNERLQIVCQERQREHFDRICLERARAELQSLKTEIERYSNDYREHRDRMVTCSRRVREARERLPLVENRVEENAKKYQGDFEKLFNIPHVVNIRIVGSAIVVKTDMIYCEHPETGSLHQIGRFEISLDASRGNVTYHNLTQVVDYGEGEFHAPHVDGAGRPCLGSLGTALPELIANYDFLSAISLSIQFLENVNPEDSWGKHITEWPIKEEAVEDNDEDGCFGGLSPSDEVCSSCRS